MAWRVQVVSVLWRLSLASLQRAEGARTVKNGSAQVRLAQGIGTASISDSQRRPLVLCEVALGGADRIAIDAAGLDPCTPAALDAVVDPDHHLALGQQPLDDRQQQAPCDGAPIPAGPAQHLVVALEARIIRQPHDPQQLGNSALARRQHRACHQNQDAVPHRGGEAGAEPREPVGQDWRDRGRIARRAGAGMVRCHRRRRIEVHPRRKSPPRRTATSASGAIYHAPS